MKTTFTLFTFLALSLFNMDASAAVGSRLHLDLFNDGNYVVVVDGVRYGNVGPKLNVNNLRAGTHQIKIVEVFGQRRGRRGARGREVLYNGSINIPFSSAVFARLTNLNRLRVVEVQRLAIQNPRRPQARQRGRRGGNVNAFSATKMQMRAAAFDRDKVAIASNFVATSRPTSNEVAQLMRMMSFDKSKLKLAKYAYPFVIDKANYQSVSRTFTFDSSVRELNRFLVQQRNTRPPVRRRAPTRRR